MSAMAPRFWRCGRFELALDRPLVMGILNVTPDSFSDGGSHEDPAAAVAHAMRMIADGSDIIDVGGESTRPGAAPVSPAEEIARVRPMVERLAEEGAVPISIDTRRADVGAACVEAGASIVNDVGGFRDPAMQELAVSTDVGVVIMHMLGEPGTMQDDPRYGDVVAEVSTFLLERATALVDAGVAPERICIDPGIGFGKTFQHNIALLRSLSTLTSHGYPLLVGASRKRFIGEITGQAEPNARLAGSLAAAMWAVSRGAAVVRVHDVAETVEHFKVRAAIEGS